MQECSIKLQQQTGPAETLLQVWNDHAPVHVSVEEFGHYPLRQSCNLFLLFPFLFIRSCNLFASLLLFICFVPCRGLAAVLSDGCSKFLLSSVIILLQCAVYLGRDFAPS